MGAKKDLIHSIDRLLEQYRSGSYATRYDRKALMHQFAKTLVDEGYTIRNIQKLKEKHIQAVVKVWKEEGLSPGTMKNRAASIRHVAKLIRKPAIMPSNDELGLQRRRYVPEHNRAIHHMDLDKIPNEFIRASLALQQAFGLRREESLKIKPQIADRGDHLELKGAWCKGGRPRRIPILTEMQRMVLEKAKALVKHPGHSMIPVNKRYITHRHLYDKQCLRADFKNLHGLRHAYAQSRYKTLTGWQSPIAGGPSYGQLNPEQRIIDQYARMTISEELGHGRIQITMNYLGK